MDSRNALPKELGSLLEHSVVGPSLPTVVTDCPSF